MHRAVTSFFQHSNKSYNSNKARETIHMQPCSSEEMDSMSPCSSCPSCFQEENTHNPLVTRALCSWPRAIMEWLSWHFSLLFAKRVQAQEKQKSDWDVVWQQWSNSLSFCRLLISGHELGCIKATEQSDAASHAAVLPNQHYWLRRQPPAAFSSLLCTEAWDRKSVV